jgi:phosphoglucosamine mutase
MKPEKIFKRYDIRGKYPEELNEDFAEQLGKSLGTFVLEEFGDTVVVSRDTKDSSVDLKESLKDGLKSTGVKVLDAGIGPTDYAALAGRNNDAVSVQVTSSHLPLEFNGFKFMYPEGNGFVNEDLNSVKDIFRSGEFSTGEGGEDDISLEAMESYFAALEETLSDLGVESIEKKVVVDTMGGATDEILQKVLSELGAEVIDLGDRKEKRPYHDPPNPKPEMLGELVDVYEEEDADIAVATDLDADRVAVYNGEFISGDEIFSIIHQITGGDVVASVDTSQAVEDLVGSSGDEIFYTRVGDPFVMDKALEEDVTLAGEPNGHYSVLEFVPYNSGTLSALLLAGIDMEESLEKAPQYTVERRNIRVEEKDETMENVAEKAHERYEVLSEVDGVKAKIGNAEVLVRPSGSSPKIRVISESSDVEEAEDAAEEAAELVRNS